MLGRMGIRALLRATDGPTYVWLHYIFLMYYLKTPHINVSSYCLQQLGTINAFYINDSGVHFLALRSRQSVTNSRWPKRLYRTIRGR